MLESADSSSISSSSESSTDTKMGSVDVCTVLLENSDTNPLALHTPDDQEGNVQQLQSDLCVVAATEQPQHRLVLPMLDIFEVDAVKNPKWSGERRTMFRRGPLDPHEVKTARQKETQYVWDMEVYEYATETEARARTGRNPVGWSVCEGAP